VRHELGAAIVLLACASAGAGQPPLVFRGSTDLVEVDVVVHDRSGGFVDDLAVDDFSIEDTGQSQTIQQFYLHGSARPAPPAKSAIADPTTALDAARTVVVVFDTAHLTPGGFRRTQSAALTLFSREFRSGDLGGVVTDGRLANGRLTTDREELLKAVKEARPTSAKGTRVLVEHEWPRLSEIEAVRIVFDRDGNVLADAVRRACSDDPLICRKVPVDTYVQSKASQLAASAQAETALTLQILRALADQLARVRGRKTILLMSEGFIAEASWPMVQDVVTLASRASARLYTLDARGLERGLTSIATPATAPDDTSAQILDRMEFGGDPLNALATDTGGFAVRDTNQFDKAIARIGGDLNTYYVLGYRPTTAPDGKFHPIKVSVKRPGVAVRARRGYVAVPRAPSATVATASDVAGSDTDVRPGADAPRAPPAAELDAGAGAPRARPEAAAPAPAPESAPTSPVAPSARARTRPGAAANALRLAPTDKADPDASEGWNAYQRGDVATAQARLAVAAGRQDAQIWVHYAFGLASYALARYREAADAWERVRSGATGFEPVYFDLIDAYVQLKELDRAIRTARDALTRWPGDPEIFQALGVVQTVRGSLDDAVNAFQAAAAIAPDDANVYFNLGKAMELRYYKSRRYVNQLGRWISNEKDREAAIANYERHVSLGGAYAESAEAGLARLNWVPRPQ
jgi:VWFA-related protein